MTCVLLPRLSLSLLLREAKTDSRRCWDEQFFSQEVFFQNPFGAERSPAAAPLPHLPADGYHMPSVLLRRQDLDRLISFCQKPVRVLPLLSTSSSKES